MTAALNLIGVFRNCLVLTIDTLFSNYVPKKGIWVYRVGEKNRCKPGRFFHTLSRIKGMTLMLLSQMREGQSGTVARVGGNGILRRRILEMGILKGAELYIEKYAPLKDPLELIVKGYHVSLRVEEAAQIDMENVR